MARLRRQIHHHRQRVVAVPMIVVTPTPPHNEIIINRSYKEEGHNVNYYMIVHQLPPRPFCHNIKTTTKKRHGVTSSTFREKEVVPATVTSSSFTLHALLPFLSILFFGDDRDRYAHRDITTQQKTSIRPIQLHLRLLYIYIHLHIIQQK